MASGREWRGGQRQVWLLASAMHRDGVNVAVVTGRGTELEARLRDDGVRVHDVTWQIGLDPRVIARLSGVVRPADLMHAHDNHAHALTDVAARFTGARVVATRRVALAPRHPARWHRASAVIALSNAIAQQMHEAGVVRHKLHVIPPGIPPIAARHDVRPSGDRDPLLVCIAALTPEKGVDVLIEAAPAILAAHPRARIVVAGDGAGRTELANRIRTLGIEHAVTLMGHVDRPELLLDGATIAMQPSLSEGFGSSVLDALVRGVPVVASATGGLPEALEGGGGMLVAPGHAGALAEAIVGLLADAPRLSRLADEGRLAARRFTVERMVAATLDVYRSA